MKTDPSDSTFLRHRLSCHQRSHSSDNKQGPTNRRCRTCPHRPPIPAKPRRLPIRNLLAINHETTQSLLKQRPMYPRDHRSAQPLTRKRHRILNIPHLTTHRRMNTPRTNTTHRPLPLSRELPPSTIQLGTLSNPEMYPPPQATQPHRDIVTFSRPRETRLRPRARTNPLCEITTDPLHYYSYPRSFSS